MFNRLYNLVVLQIGDKFINKNKKVEVMPILFKILGFIAISVISYLLFMVLEKVIYLKPTNSMILFIIFISQLITLVGNAMSLTDSLYGSKDNAILLSLPARHYEIFISKLIVFYILELYGNLMFMFPILLGTGIYMKQPFAYFALSFLICILLPLLSVLLGAFISILLSLIAKLLKKVSFIYAIFFICFVGVLFYLAIGLINKLPNPLRFMALYNYIIELIMEFIDNTNSYSLFYSWFSNVIFEIKPLENLLWIVLLIIGLIGVNVVTSWPLFFKLASNSSESATTKKHKGINKESKSIFISFFKKEVLISIRKFGSLVEDYSMVIFMPLVLYLIDGLFNSFDLNSMGKAIIVGFNIIVGTLMMISSNSTSAKALSEEGSEFILLKTAPVNTKLIAYVKILNNAMISALLLSVSMIILAILKIFNVAEMLIILFSLIFINFGHILWSFQLDLRNPQIKDMALFGNISNKENITKSLVIGLMLALIFGVLAILFRYLNIMWLYIIIVILFTIWRFIVFDANLKSYFYDIEL